jgi:Fic family protein
MEQHIRESNLIEGIDDPAHDKQGMIAWLWLLKQKKLDHSIICHLQKRITLKQDMPPHWRGYYRDTAQVNVTVGGRVPPAYHLVRGLMDNWLLDYKKLGPLQAHIRFEKIHPFCDGNGRAGRMLLWWHQLQVGELPTLFLATEKNEKYYPLFQE